MTDHPLCHHHVEWPAPGARVAGPIVWVRGWLVPKPGWTFDAVRARTADGLHLGVLGFPRADLARHFGATAAWLPAEFLVGVAARDGALTLQLEARAASGEWVGLGALPCTVAPDGATAPSGGGELRSDAAGALLERGPHAPAGGFLDEPAPDAVAPLGRVRVFGWLTHATQPIRAVTAALGGENPQHLAHGLADAALAKKFPARPEIGASRFEGWVDCPAELPEPACLRIWAELGDGSVQLCFARWIRAVRPAVVAAPLATTSVEAELPPLPSGRPRRLLLVLRTLRNSDATGRALDVVRHLHAEGRWSARAVATEDGPLGAAFEAAGCPVQTIDVTGYFARPAAAELVALQRQIWWRHLDAVAVFDAEQTWAGEIARRLDLPCLADPAGALPWAAADDGAARPGGRTLLAPLEPGAEHGVHVLRQAVRWLETRQAADWEDWEIVLPADPDGRFDLAGVSSLRTGPSPDAAAAVVCPAFQHHPHRALLGAALAGVPVITTPDAVLAATFRAGELDFVPPNQPLALAHALLAFVRLPAAAGRRAAAAQRLAAAHHAPAALLPRWRRVLEAAARR